MSVLYYIVTPIVVSLITLAGVMYTLKRNIYSQIVSDSRNRWIDDFRKNIAEALAAANTYSYFYSYLSSSNSKKVQMSDLMEYYNRFYISRNMVLAKLNLNEEKHQNLKSKLMKINLDEVSSNGSRIDFDNKLEQTILEQTRDTLKEEWERVKDEADGQK